MAPRHSARGPRLICARPEIGTKVIALRWARSSSLSSKLRFELCSAIRSVTRFIIVDFAGYSCAGFHTRCFTDLKETDSLYLAFYMPGVIIRNFC